MSFKTFVQIVPIIFFAYTFLVNAAYGKTGKSMTIEIDAAAEEGMINPLYTPSVFASWSTREAQELFSKDAKKLGMVRLSVEYAMSTSTSMDDYVQKIRKIGKQWKRIEQKQGRIVLTIARMPLWLSSNQSKKKLSQHDFLAYEASPPKNYELWSQLVYETVKHFNGDLGLDLYYELWNEPDSKGFWLGTEEEFFKLYKYFVLGARSADSHAKVGGPTVASPGGVIGKQPAVESRPSIYNFIEYANRESIPDLGLLRLPIDFLVWHQFNADPYRGWTKPVNQIKKSLEQYNYEQTILIVDEWALWSTRAFNDPLRDTEYAAAYTAATLYGMDTAGINFQSIAALQDFASDPQNIFHGDFGILTKENMGYMLKKPAYNAIMMHNATTGGMKIKTVLHNSATTSSIPTVGALATKHADRITILVWNYIAPVREYFLTHLQDLGYSPDILQKKIKKKHPRLSEKDAQRFMKDENAIDTLGISAEAKKNLKNARISALKSRVLTKELVSIDLKLKNPPFSSMKYERFAIDSSHSNSFSQYQRARKQGKSEKDALQTAKEHQELEKVEEKILNKTDTIDPFLAEPYSVHLITLTRP